MVAILANRSSLTESELYNLTANLSRISNRTAEGTSEFPSDLIIATSVLKFSVKYVCYYAWQLNDHCFNAVP